MTLLDELVPAWDFDERHGIRAAAPAARLLDAVREVTPAETPLLRALFLLRGLSARAQEPIWAQLLRGGFRVLGERPGVEVVVGAIGRPWRVWERLRGDVDFAAFAEPGYVKMAMGLLARDGELRVWCALESEEDERIFDERYLPELRSWLDLDIEHVLVAHGEQLPGGRDLLAAALERPPYEPV